MVDTYKEKDKVVSFMRKHFLQVKTNKNTPRQNEHKGRRKSSVVFWIKNSVTILVLSLGVILVGCEENTARTIDMYNADKDMVGTVKLSENTGGVKAEVKVEGLPEGFHGIHVHESPDCSGPGFKNAGNHLNPTSEKHGLMNSEGAHLGDLPNIETDQDGKMKGEVTVIDATLLDGKNSLKGSSIIITEGKDDGMTQPSRDSGKRIICGTIEKSSGKEEESPSDPTGE